MRVLTCLLLAITPLLPAAAKPPNVIVIIADDLGWNDLSCQGQKNFATPALDRMAAEGMRFTDHYAGSTVCLPSRCALLTGRDMGHASIRGNGDFALDPDKEPLLPMAFRQAGYRTAMIGKSSVHSTLDANRPAQCGFDSFFGYLVHREAHNHYPDFLWRDGGKVPLPGNADRQGTQYAEDLFHEEARKWIAAGDPRPFFLLLSLAVPHADVSAPEESIAPFRGKFTENPIRQGAYRFTKEPAATHAAMVTRMDREIGTLLDQLRRDHTNGQTMVIFTSDNGGHSEGGHDYRTFGSNAPFRGGKRDLTEGGLRVPFLVWWPGKIQPGVTPHVSASWDIFPTLAELAGITPPAATEGISFAPLLLGKPRQPAHAHLYWEFHEQGGKQAVRMGPWKAIRLEAQTHPDARPALYHLESDPSESTDLADREPAILARMTAVMDARQPSPVPNWNFQKPRQK